MINKVILITVIVLLQISNVLAHDDSMVMDSMSLKSTTAEGIGIVDNVDRVKGEVTLSHEPIASLNWPAMTMDFTVEDKTIFKKLVVGKKVKFQFIKQGNHYVVKSVSKY